MDLSDSQANLSVKFIFMYCRVPSHFLCVEHSFHPHIYMVQYCGKQIVLVEKYNAIQFLVDTDKLFSTHDD